MRLFIAINLNQEIRGHLIEAIKRLKGKSQGGSFPIAENLHLTLVFLGEVSSERVEAVKSAMNQVRTGAFSLTVSGFGRFKRNGGDIHWAGIEENKWLLDLQGQLSNELAESGFQIEKRKFSPHLTLGRAVRLMDLEGDIYGELKQQTPGMIVEKISLMKSERIGGKLIYTEIYSRNFSEN